MCDCKVNANTADMYRNYQNVYLWKIDTKYRNLYALMNKSAKKKLMDNEMRYYTPNKCE